MSLAQKVTTDAVQPPAGRRTERVVFKQPASAFKRPRVFVDCGFCAARKLGVLLQPQPVSDPDQFSDAFATIVAEGAQALWWC